jgi:ubiquinone/menaquinone biosynthesis C-methylase UbiE
MENHLKFRNHLRLISDENDEIYNFHERSLSQHREVEIRDAGALSAPDDIDALMRLVSHHHSVEVMKCEIRKFIDSVPFGGIILDVGVGWGWHWLGLSVYRPDLLVCVLDFSLQSLVRAKKVLAKESSNSFIYVCGNALNLKFESESINGYWSVQTLQHVDSFETAITEAHRVLVDGSQFVSYSLNTQPVIRSLYNVLGRSYVINGEYSEGINLSRASTEQFAVVERVFGAPVEARYSEILFSPEILLNFPGRQKSLLGKIDNLLTGNSFFSRNFARQCSYHALKDNQLEVNR